MTVADFALLASISTIDAIDFYMKNYEKIQNWLKNCSEMKYYGANKKGIGEIVSLLRPKDANKRENKINNNKKSQYLEIIFGAKF
ncbi:uncharacterized protein LOC100572028 [Acyrthosiphon pisum]|uniref:Uncharacterized protein n=1 Tax=Acyrthosiphon pisum TaxID=7029 RepID=A0A8R2H9U6_ACYPI|nr:uncharacterized protein LOC100572028 [Acyrthosiphon pisum]|eukprot:XP_016662561.1 PREDICTED: uncharacterized protein LOC100572028 [Acyrthosiphon pisum]